MKFNKDALRKMERKNEPVHTILLVDDEPDNLYTQKGLLSDDYQVICAEGGEQALEILESRPADQPIHLIMSDQRMPGMSGVAFLEKTLTISPQSIRIILTGYSDIDAVMEAVNKAQVYQFLLKPYESASLLRTIQLALEAYEMDRTNTKLLARLTALNATLEDKVNERTRDLEQAKQVIERKNKMLESLLETSAILHKPMSTRELLVAGVSNLSRLFPNHGFGVILRGERIRIVREAFFLGLEEEVQQNLVANQSTLLEEGGCDVLQEPVTDEDPLQRTCWITRPINTGTGICCGVMVIRSPINDRPEMGLIRVFLDIMGSLLQNKDLMAALKKTADTDVLTGAYNRQYLDRQLNKFIQQKTRLRGPDFVILFIDINGLKKVNDHYGHEAGDHLIKLSTDILLKASRTSDIVARYGGDELVILCPATTQDQAGILAERINKMFDEAHLEIDDERLSIHCSIGIAGSHEFPPDQVLEKADERMYQAKQEWYRTRERYR